MYCLLQTALLIRMGINLLLVAMIELVKFGILRLVTFSILYKDIKMQSILWLLMFLSGK